MLKNLAPLCRAHLTSARVRAFMETGLEAIVKAWNLWFVGHLTVLTPSLSASNWIFPSPMPELLRIRKQNWIWLFRVCRHVMPCERSAWCCALIFFCPTCEIQEQKLHSRRMKLETFLRRLKREIQSFLWLLRLAFCCCVRWTFIIELIFNRIAW